MLDKKLEETHADLAVLACLPEMYLDEDVDVGEAHALFQRSMRAVRQTIADRDAIGLVTNAGLSKLYRRRSIRRQLYESADRVVRIAHGRNGVLITRSDADVAEWYRPVPPDQRTLDDFEDARPRIVDLAAISEPRAIRNAEHMRFSW